MMAVWSTVYVENWKRRQATIAFLWGMTEIDEVSSKRVQKNSDFIVDPITQQKRKAVIVNEDCKNLTRAILIVLLGASIAAGLYLFNRFLKRQYNFCCSEREANNKIMWDMLMTAIHALIII
mmetsp:Transcript_42872/g.30902  ORF Transcript_42872/g.30902 Transcript_42872/m.30902 type:complete len:122 (-) Transcript_42872:1327-1692(-)